MRPGSLPLLLQPDPVLLRWMGARGTAEPSELKAENLLPISRTEISWAHGLSPKAKKFSCQIRVYLCLSVSLKSN